MIQSDSASVYKYGEFAAHCAAQGIFQRFSAPFSQAQNGRAERFWRTLENQITAMYAYSHLVPINFWVYAAYNFVHVHNRTVAHGKTATPFELLTGSKPDISHFRVWGCPAYAFIEKSAHDKFEPKSRPGINLGFDTSTKDAYLIYFPDTKQVLTTRNVAFDELWRVRAEYYQTLQQAQPEHSLFPPASLTAPALTSDVTPPLPQ